MTETPNRVSSLPEPAEDHYMGLTGAYPVATDAAREAERIITSAVENRCMVCIHGQVGLGKTFAVHKALRKIAPDNTVRLRFDTSSSKSEVFHTMWRRLGIPGEPPGDLAACKGEIKQTLARAPYVILLDEVQNVTARTMESIRILWDDEKTLLTVVFVGSGNTRQRVFHHQPLHSRIHEWQQFRPLRLNEVFTTMPAYHTVWSEVDDDLLAHADDRAGHGYFRNWARITFHAQEILRENPNLTMNKDLIDWILSKLDSTQRYPGLRRGGPHA